jgi:hypothetical protein
MFDLEKIEEALKTTGRIISEVAVIATSIVTIVSVFSDNNNNSNNNN